MFLETTIFLGKAVLLCGVCLAVAWLFFDTLFLRLEVRMLFKGLGFLLIGISQITEIAGHFFGFPLPLVSYGLMALGFYFILIAFLADAHSKFSFIIVALIVFLFLFKDHQLLAVSAFTISLTVLQIAYYTKHKDFIPLGVGFVLMTIGEFFYFLESLNLFEKIRISGDFLYIFASFAFVVWVWPYFVNRFRIKILRSAANQ